MKKQISLVLLLLSGLFLPLLAAAEETMHIRCENVEVDVPAGWLVTYTQSPPLFVLYAPPKENDTFPEIVNLVVELLPQKMSVPEYMQASMETLKTVFSTIEPVESGDGFHINSVEINGVHLLQIQFFFVRNSTAYVLTCSADPEDFPRYRDTFTAIADTVVIDGRGSEE